VDARIEELTHSGNGHPRVDMLRLHPYPDRELPAHVKEAVLSSLGDRTNAPSQGLPALRRSIALTVGAELGLTVDPDSEVLVTAGSMHALCVAFRTLLESGDEVLIPAPCYFLEGIIEPLEARGIYVPMHEEKEYGWDFERLEAAITNRTKCVFLNTPVNPTGYVLSPDDLAELARLASAYNLLIIADESYNTMLYDGRIHRSIASVPGMKDRTLLIRSFTKSFAMPAWRVGFVVAHPELLGPMVNTLEWNVLYGSSITQVAATAALNGPLDWLAGVAGEFEYRRDILCNGLREIPLLSCVRPSGGPFLFLNVSRLRGDSCEISRALLEWYGIPTTPGIYFRSAEHVRMAIGAEPDVLEQVLCRLAQASRDLAKPSKDYVTP
jgi:aspartate/methionine/tyrosine aminotransferase